VAQGASTLCDLVFTVVQQAPKGEGILLFIHNGVISVNTLADATVPEKILLAAFQLEEEGKSPFSAEDLIVASWKRFPKTLGLKGYAELYPDSNKVLSSIMGVKGLVRRHWLDKKGQKLYSLSREGSHIVRKLQQGDESPAAEPSPRLSREHDKLLLHLLGAAVTRKYEDDRRNELTFGEACRFWGINENSHGESLDSRLHRFRTTLRELERQLAGGSADLSNGRSISENDVERLTEVHDYLEDRFARHLNLLRTRSERT
jgi:hypothetical protein